MKTIKRAALAALFLPAVASADLSETTGLLCAHSNAYECSSPLECKAVDLDDLDIARFLEFDLDKGTVKSLDIYQPREERKIPNIERNDGAIVISGILKEFAFGLSITEETGEMVMTAAGLNHGYVVFGACTAR